LNINDVSIADVVAKKIWRVVVQDDENPINSTIDEIKRIGSNDTILHSAVLVEKGVAVYPILLTKYYEDGGEVGEYFIHLNGCWNFLDSSIPIVGETEGEYLSFISTLDIHEYQKGSFDNRKEHYAKFDFYSKQIGKCPIEIYPEKSSTLSRRICNMPVEKQISHIRTCILESKAHHAAFRVSKGNKKITEALNLTELVKASEEGRKQLRELLTDTEKPVRQTMMYLLRDIYKDECFKMITETSKEDSLEGLAARMNLSKPDLFLKK
jgi:hypothetical protein